ncbi:MAG: ImmA/IrrE family metallo-endopeptidase, partial [Thermodesulfobacteriota bacterium]|nr:ImmA/IrrE family metallo-endopeptidase [Thermodesulfobacteriota bacterium]
EILHWARQRAGLSVEDLRRKFPKVADWLRGELAPTLKQLEAFARMTRTPVGFFFLPEPPDISLPIPDFRTMVAERPVSPSPDLLETIYLCQQRQDWYRDYAHLYGEEALAWIGSGTVEADVVEVAARLRNIIGFDLTERQRCATWGDALRFFIERVEKTGVLVMVSGIVGSNTHRKLSPEEFRGFALVDSHAPVIFINGADSKSAQMFTLAHELTHLWLGEAGVSDSQVVRWPEKGVEYWCNAVAAELLVPLEAVLQEYRPEERIEKEIQRLAKKFKVSTLVALRRIFDLGGIDSETLWQIYRDELDRLQQLNKGGAGGGDFYRTLGTRDSKRFVRAVIGSTLEGQTLFRDAFRLLGIRKSATFYRAASEFGGN